MKRSLPEFPITLAERFAKLALNCVFQEYPHVHLYWLENAEECQIPRQLTPAFYGCLDWHSAVHNHWMLVRLLRWFPDADFAEAATQALNQNLTSENIAQEAKYLKKHPRFECPYGLAWLLQLTAELTEWEHPQGKIWLEILKPLEAIASENLEAWLIELYCPNRTGMHTQTAFALGLIWDWAKITQNISFLHGVESKSKQFYLHNYNYPFHIEPLGYDFLSPGLAEADLMRRILPACEFEVWLSRFMPQLSTTDGIDSLKPIRIENPENYSHSHFDGLHLSRAWMLEGIISTLNEDDPRIPTLQNIAHLHRQVGLNPISADCYSGSHWLGSFAVYLATGRGL